jgi:hypothetical protein
MLSEMYGESISDVIKLSTRVVKDIKDLTNPPVTPFRISFIIITAAMDKMATENKLKVIIYSFYK